mmetsp:Transcript_16301/g.20909  ORF Transcript_16301/g.20909 Transcript_16301/m.20909 type:complete len:563 (-) Transcript_16301:732-2420(-)
MSNSNSSPNTPTSGHIFRPPILFRNRELDPDAASAEAASMNAVLPASAAQEVRQDVLHIGTAGTSTYRNSSHDIYSFIETWHRSQNNENSMKTNNELSDSVANENAGLEDVVLLSEQLSVLVNQAETSDVEFLVGVNKERIYAHRAILAARSAVFHAMLFGSLREAREREVVVPNISKEVFLCLLQYVYGGNTNITAENAMAILAAANQYEILPLVHKCGEYIHESLSSDNVCMILVQCQGYSEIYDKCIEFIEGNAAQVFDSTYFLDLPESVLIDLVKKDRLSIQEMSLFKALLKWGKHQCSLEDNDDNEDEEENPNYSTVAVSPQTRVLRHYLRNLIQHVRLPLIGATDLVRVVKPSEVIPSHLYLKAMEYLAAPEEVDTGGAAFYRRRVGYGPYGPLFTFQWEIENENSAHYGFKFANAERIAMRIGEDKWNGVFGNKSIIVSGKKQDIMFEILIKRIADDRSGMVIGLARKQDKAYSSCWGYGGSGYSYPSQTRAQIKHNEFQVGDVIGVRFEGVKRQVSFFKNGDLQFVNSRQPPIGTELHPVVHMYYNSDEVEIRY